MICISRLSICNSANITLQCSHSSWFPRWSVLTVFALCEHKMKHFIAYTAYIYDYLTLSFTFFNSYFHSYSLIIIVQLYYYYHSLKMRPCISLHILYEQKTFANNFIFLHLIVSSYDYDFYSTSRAV